MLVAMGTQTPRISRKQVISKICLFLFTCCSTIRKIKFNVGRQNVFKGEPRGKFNSSGKSMSAEQRVSLEMQKKNNDPILSNKLWTFAAYRIIKNWIWEKLLVFAIIKLQKTQQYSTDSGSFQKFQEPIFQDLCEAQP